MRGWKAFGAAWCIALALGAYAEGPPWTPNAKVRVVDGEGRPVTEITVHRAENLFGRYIAMHVEHVVPAPDAAPVTMRSEAGEYEVPLGSLVWAQGRCRRLVSSDLKPESGPWTVILTPARSLTLRIHRDDFFSPEGLYVVPTRQNGLPQRGNSPPTRAARTDGRGEIEFDGLPPGTYAFAVLRDDPFDPLLGFVYGRIDAKRDAVVEGVVGTWPAGSGEALLDIYGRLDYGDERKKLAENLTERELQQVKTALRRRLDTKGLAVDPYLHQWIWLSMELDVRGIVAPLKAIIEMGDDSGTEFGRFDSFVSAIAAIEGGKAAPYLAALALNRERPSSARRAAVVALFRMNTPKSLRAWERLREEARRLPGAPAAQVSYTHAERMAETMTFVLAVIPGEELNYEIDAASAYVDEDYTGGYIDVGSVRYTMRRVGDEWLPEGTYVSTSGDVLVYGRL